MKAFIFVLIISTGFTAAFSQNNFKTKRVTVFKDGTVFFEKEGNFEVSNKQIKISILPFTYETGLLDVESYSAYNRSEITNRLILGSLWFSCKDNVIDEVVVNKDTIHSPEKAHNIFTLFRSNIGKRVSILEKDGSEEITGTIENFFSDQYANFYRNSIVIRSENGIAVLDVNDIKKINFLEEPILTSDQQNITKRAILKLKNERKNQLVYLSYLQKGITWIPNYLIEIEDNKKGKLKLEGYLMNDIEQLEDVEVNLAVGVPAFNFSYVSSPLASESSVLNTVAQLANPPSESAALTISNVTSQRARPSGPIYNTNYTPQIEGTTGNDLFFYTKQNITIPKDGRAKLNILEAPFIYEDIYSVELQPNESRFKQREYNSKDWENTIWHSIKFKNNTTIPFTTGVVMFQQKKGDQLQLLAQNQMNYTPPNEYATVKMSVSPDIWIQDEDKEISRVAQGYDHLLAIEATIDVINYKTEEVTLLLERKITGDLESSNKTWQTNAILEKGYHDNKVNQVTWKVTIPPGKTEQIKYSYKIVVE